jgi:hypothetical protein
VSPSRPLRRLEQGDYGSRPSLQYLSSCAVALGCDSLLDLIEDEFLGWTSTGEAKEPPEPLPDWSRGRPPTLDAASPGLKHARPVKQHRPKRQPTTKADSLREFEELQGYEV